MATSAQESGSTRSSGYPAIPEETWWRLRRLFKSRGQPRPSWNEDYLINMDIRKTKASAGNVVRIFKRMGIFTEDGKPTPRYWDWVDDTKYRDVCQQIIQDVYPETVVHTFTVADEEEQRRLEGWFQRAIDVAPKTATQYAAFYMLLLAGDPSKEDEVIASKTPRMPRATRDQTKNGKSRSSSTSAQSAMFDGAETFNNGITSTDSGHYTEHQHAAHRRVVRGVEPSLNINVQIHIPAEASPDQIDQIFKSMAKHLYQRQDEGSE